ncbi:Redoxin [Artemisia annua]|uniref:Glutaredoxin-dependent peroxiredoxin n=1 Tax=Artemisia annua TaxID=35608 RepID=A0A2U1KFQ6_ARTAN|nr:Redoxin [Artemisia annua]
MRIKGLSLLLYLCGTTLFHQLTRLVLLEISSFRTGAFTGVCTAQHVPSYKKNIDKFKAKGVDSVICVSVNDPYTMNGWAEKLEAKDAIEFYGDFDGKFHKSLDLELDLSSALLGHRSTRWSAFVEDGKVKVLNVENVPSEFKVSGGELINDLLLSS